MILRKDLHDCLISGIPSLGTTDNYFLDIRSLYNAFRDKFLGFAHNLTKLEDDIYSVTIGFCSATAELDPHKIIDFITVKQPFSSLQERITSFVKSLEEAVRILLYCVAFFNRLLLGFLQRQRRSYHANY